MKKVIISYMLVLGLVGCGSSADSAEETDKIENETFETISTSNINDFDEVMEIRHKETGCHYTIVDVSKGGGITQMFIEKNGVSVPYCD